MHRTLEFSFNGGFGKATLSITGFEGIDDPSSDLSCPAWAMVTTEAGNFICSLNELPPAIGNPTNYGWVLESREYGELVQLLVLITFRNGRRPMEPIGKLVRDCFGPALQEIDSLLNRATKRVPALR